MECMVKVRIGVQTSISGGIQNAVRREKKKGGNCGQIFSHSPQSWDEPSVEEDEMKNFKSMCKANNIRPWIIHTSYLVNLCTPKEELGRKSKHSMQQEVNIASKLDIKYVNTHLGAHTGSGVQTGLRNAAKRIDDIEVPEDVEIVIETDAGGGTRIGHKMQQLETVQSLTDTNLKFCIDTAHIWAAGYQIDTRSGVSSTIEKFDTLIGLDNLVLVHLNDSKHDIGTNRDEHEHLGRGTIGKEGIESVVEWCEKLDIPMIAETPITDSRGDEENIKFVRDVLNSDASK